MDTPNQPAALRYECVLIHFHVHRDVYMCGCVSPFNFIHANLNLSVAYFIATPNRTHTMYYESDGNTKQNVVYLFHCIHTFSPSIA